MKVKASDLHLKLFLKQFLYLCSSSLSCNPGNLVLIASMHSDLHQSVYRNILEAVPQLSALHFNLAPMPLVILTTGTSCLVWKLNYSEALGLNEVHYWISPSTVSAAVSFAYQGTYWNPMRTSWANGEEEDNWVNVCSLIHSSLTQMYESCVFWILQQETHRKQCKYFQSQGKIQWIIILCWFFAY